MAGRYVYAALAVLLVVVVGVVWGRGRGGAGQAGAAPPVHVDERLTSAVNDFGFRIYRDLAKRKPDENVFISPASVEVAFAITYGGARGATQTEIAKVFGYDGMTGDQVNQANADLAALLCSSSPNVEFCLANSLWPAKGAPIDQGYVSKSSRAFGASAQAIAPAAAKSVDRINAWVSEKTHGRITQIAEPSDMVNAQLVIMNALYFKGDWTAKFDAANTQPGDFTKLDGSAIPVPMMSQRGQFAYARSDEAEAIRLPYGDKRFAATIVLPRRDASFGEFVGGLDAAKLRSLTDRMTQQEGAIVLPKFKIEYGTSLRDSLVALGMPRAFDGRADFSGMLTGGGAGIFIGAAKHKTTLEVDEEGTVAAAATEVVMKGKGAAVGGFTMVVDHPFVMLIEDTKTGVLLFVGSIVQPE